VLSGWSIGNLFSFGEGNDIMKYFQKIGLRILLPAVSVTAIFSIALFFIGNSVFHHLMKQSFDRIVQSKMAEISTNEKRTAENALTQASLFSQDKSVLGAYETAYQGNLNTTDDPQMGLARQQLYTYFASIEKGYKETHGGQSLRLHFHVPPARSLLRLWNKNQTKSDLSLIHI
jgi:methyl-accepting chemotaxis protein